MGWHLSPNDIDPIALGCSFLGSGGGGDPYQARLILRQLLDAGETVTLMYPDEIPDDSVTMTVGFVGAPVTLQEKLLGQTEIVAGIDAMRAQLGVSAKQLIAAEIGGMNGMVPLVAGALTGLPVVDADGMGRAFPRNDHVAFAIYGQSALPTCVAAEDGSLVLIQQATNARAEDLVRALSGAMGSKCFSVDYPLSAEAVRRYAVPSTVSLARDIGMAITASSGDIGKVAAMLHAQWHLPMRQIYAGRVIDRSHETHGGFDRGSVAVRGTDGTLIIDFQNEYLAATIGGDVLASTPDIISLLDAETLHPLSSDVVRYGQRVIVAVMLAPALMRTERALEAVGPKAFGFGFDYLPISAELQAAS